MPSTLERSDEKALDISERDIRESARFGGPVVGGDESRAHRVAYSAVKHTHEKIGDHWEPKQGKRPSEGSSDAQAEGSVETSRPTAEGVDANASRKHLQEVARSLDIAGRSTMEKSELVEAVKRENRRRTARARSS